MVARLGLYLENQTRLDDAPDSAGKWLVLAGDTAACWRLPDDTNLNYLEALIKAAMRGGDALTVEVQPDASTRSRLVLSGRSLPFVVIREVVGDDAPAKI